MAPATYGSIVADAAPPANRWRRAGVIIGGVLAVEGLFMAGLFETKERAAARLVASATAACASPISSLRDEVVVVRNAEDHKPEHWAKLGPSTDACAEHEIVVATKQADMQKLDAELMKVSSPGSANYRKYWTHAMVGELLDNAAHVAAVKSWLSDAGAREIGDVRLREDQGASADSSSSEYFTPSAVFETASQNYSPDDLEEFRYDPFLKYAMDIADMEHPILVSSISWGSIEPANPLKVMEAFNAEVAKIGLMGSTVFGRGYPDLSLSGWGYEVAIGGLLYIVCGTSCSSPSVAGMVGRINADRLAEGKPPGDNKCTDAGLCCDEGFYASKSWDPVTGWGSVSFEGLEAVLGEYDEDTDELFPLYWTAAEDAGSWDFDRAQYALWFTEQVGGGVELERRAG
ncbi:serine-type peptidase [Aureococcus anophagefferens]|uniref:subtilisin n=1 Tax=Aureococcus anophagefferens TaxID=44056 RepID=A0ABR1FGS3_AURAN